MKKLLALSLALILAISMFACGESKKRNDDASPKAMFDEIVTLLGVSAEDDAAEIYYSTADKDYLKFNDDMLSGKYGELTDYPSADMFADYAVYFSYESYGTEFGIFKMKTNDDAKKMELYIKSRIALWLKNAINYPEMDPTLFENYTVKVDGIWVYYAATTNNDGVNKIVNDTLYS